VSFPEPAADGAIGAVAGLLIVGAIVVGVIVVGMIVFGMIVVGAPVGAPRDTSPDVIVMGWGGDDRIFSGFAWNFARQPAEQKKYSLPLCSVL
jgi:hypothetical protein